MGKQKKLKLLSLFVCTFVLICCAFLCSFSNAEKKTEENPSIQVNSSILAPENTGKKIASNALDSDLYASLLEIYKTFSGVSSAEDSIYENSFSDLTEIDLSNQRIESLDNLNYLNFANLETLHLNGNSIKTVNSSQFSTMPKLQTLYLNDQKEDILTDVDLNISPKNSKETYDLSSIKHLNVAGNMVETIKLSALSKTLDDVYYGLTELIANDNNITEIDLSKLSPVSSTNTIYINLASNKFSNLSQIKLPSDSKINGVLNLILMNNDIKNISNLSTKINYKLGIQGISKSAFVSTDTNNQKTIATDYDLTYHKLNIENACLKIVQYKSNNNEKQVVRTFYIKEADYENSLINLMSILGIGEFEISQGVLIDEIFTSHSYIINSDLKYNENEFIKTYNISIIPAKPTFIITYKGKQYTPSTCPKLTSPASVKLTTDIENAKIYYTSDKMSDWVEASEFKITKGGSTNYYTKVAVDGVESEIQITFIKASTNLYLPDIVIILIILAIGCLLFLVAFPLIMKWSKKR